MHRWERPSKSVDSNSGAVAALEKFRVSTKIIRPVLHHESRILQFHRDITVLLGYCQRDHVEYITIELPGDDLSRMHQSLAGVNVNTVANVVRTVS